MDEATRLAFLAFSETRPEDCKCRAHIEWIHGTMIDKPDDKICVRERLWRTYCRTRDKEIN